MNKKLQKYNEYLDFNKAKTNLKDVAKFTDLIKSDYFSENFGNDIYIKPENLQVTGAFKIRGSYNKISKLNSEEKRCGLITASAGNHAQGVAYAAKKLCVEAVIVMPNNTPLIKINGTKKFGAKVIIHGDNYDEAYDYASRLCDEKNYTFIHPFNDLDVIEGQGTIALEILEQLPDCDIIIAPIGGGGLIAGIATAAKRINPKVKIIGAEPIGANCMNQSIVDGHVVCLDDVCTIADGVAVKKPGDITYTLTEEYVDEIMTASDFEIMDAFIDLMEKHKLISESSGALSLAIAKKIKPEGKKIVSVLSGGNIDTVTISSMVRRGLVSKGRILSFSIALRDKPMELVNILNIISGLGANIIEVYHDQFESVDKLSDIMLHIRIETNGHEHIKEITDKLYEKGYNVKTTI